jgi:hypothetical protein
MVESTTGRGVYLAHSPDYTVIVPFGNELECLRYAVTNQLTYKRAPYGENLLDTPNVERPTRKRRGKGRVQAPTDAPTAGLVGTDAPATAEIYPPVAVSTAGPARLVDDHGEPVTAEPSVTVYQPGHPPIVDDTPVALGCDCAGDGDYHPVGTGGCVLVAAEHTPPVPVDEFAGMIAETAAAADLLGPLQASVDAAREARHTARLEAHPGGLDEFMAARRSERNHAEFYDQDAIRSRDQADAEFPADDRSEREADAAADHIGTDR